MLSSKRRETKSTLRLLRSPDLFALTLRTVAYCTVPVHCTVPVRRVPYGTRTVLYRVPGVFSPVPVTGSDGYCSRSCVWGVTARSILYAIHNGAAGVDPDTLHTRATTARLFTLTPFVSFETMARPRLHHWTDAVLPCRHRPFDAASRPRATGHLTRRYRRLSGRTFSSFFSRPMPCIFPTAGFEPLLLHTRLSSPGLLARGRKAPTYE